MKRLLTLACLTILAFASLTISLADGYGVATIDGLDADRVHLRSAPSADAPSLGLYFTGTGVACLSDPAQTWVQVSIGAETGYMMSKYLTNEPVLSQQRLGTVSAGSVNFRQGPSLQAGLFSTLAEGTTLTVHGETADHWYYASTGGKTGYVMASYVTLGKTVSGVTAAPAGEPVTVRFDRADCIEAHIRAANCCVYVYPTDDTAVTCTYFPHWVHLNASSDRGASILFFESASGLPDLERVHAANVYLPRAQFERLYFYAESGVGYINGGLDSSLIVYGDHAQVDLCIATTFDRNLQMSLTDSTGTIALSESLDHYALAVTGILDSRVDTESLHGAPAYVPGAASYAYAVGNGSAQLNVESHTRSTLTLYVMSTRWTDK